MGSYFIKSGLGYLAGRDAGVWEGERSKRECAKRYDEIPPGTKLIARWKTCQKQCRNKNRERSLSTNQLIKRIVRACQSKPKIWLVRVHQLP